MPWRHSNFPSSETPRDVVVHHPHRLHESVTDSRADEGEAAFAEVLAQGIRFGSAGRNLLHGLRSVFLRRPTDELPHIDVEASEFALHFQERLRIFHRAFN